MMSYVTQNTAWPADASPAVRQLVARLYELADSPSSDAGPLLASDVFTSDAAWYAPGGKPPIVGSEAIACSRDHAWDTVARRQHTIQKVFASISRAGANGDRREMVLLGTLEQGLKNGQSMEVGFAAHINVAAADSEAPRVQTMRVYAVSRLHVTH